jgi:hypothetical protein
LAVANQENQCSVECVPQKKSTYNSNVQNAKKGFMLVPVSEDITQNCTLKAVWYYDGKSGTKYCNYTITSLTAFELTG